MTKTKVFTVTKNTGVALGLVMILISLAISGVVYAKSVENKVDLIEERESNHYESLSDDMQRIENKIDILTNNIYNINKEVD